MAETERESLERYAWIIEDWTPERLDIELASAFLNLSDLDKNRNLDLWEKIRDALIGNPHLKDREMKRYLTFQDLADDEGCWWCDPKQWKKKK